MIQSAIAKSIYSVLFFLDEKLFKKVSEYSYETAPYCGHHFSGHNGRFTKSSYHESMGGCSGKFLFDLFSVYKNSEEHYWEFMFNYGFKTEVFVKVGKGLLRSSTRYYIKGIFQSIAIKKKLVSEGKIEVKIETKFMRLVNY